MKKSIITDPIDPVDFNQLKLVYACEDCTYFNAKENLCNMGFHTEPHLKKNQLKSYNLGGRMAICRFLEID